MQKWMNTGGAAGPAQKAYKIFLYTIHTFQVGKEEYDLLITSKGKNALKLMLNLSLHKDGGYIRLKDIAQEEGVSEKYLEQIVSYLVKARKVRSTRGNNGGYRLTKVPEDYTVGEIIKCLEGDLAASDCVHMDEQMCERRERCFCYPLWKKLDLALNEVLEQTTLQDLIDWKTKDKKECDSHE